MPLRYQTIRKFSSESGYTESAIRTKIRDGIWLQNRQWVKAPDGRILIYVEGYYEWVEKSKVSSQPVKRKPYSPLPFNSPGNKGGSSPPPLT